MSPTLRKRDPWTGLAGTALPTPTDPFVKLLVLLPGETHAPGTATGKTGTPTTQRPNVPFQVQVLAVSATYALCFSTHLIGLSRSDGLSGPGQKHMASGAVSFPVTILASGTYTFTARDLTDATKTAGTSASLTVSVSGFSKLLLLLPGETLAPGTTTGKAGTALPQTAGVPFFVSVLAVDNQYNFVSTVTDVIAFTVSDVNAFVPVTGAALIDGARIYQVILLQTAGTFTITASDTTDPTKGASVSSPLVATAAGFSKLLVLLPGETHAPGTATGKLGAPSQQTAGSSFLVTVIAVDDTWNAETSTDTVHLASSDGAASLPANAAMVAGTKVFSVTLNTAGSQTITASDVTDATKTAYVSAAVGVVSGVSVNVALASNGATATASSFYDAGRGPSDTNNGERNGIGAYLGGYWNTLSQTMPHWLQIDFGGSKSINEIDVFMVQDAVFSPIAPTLALTGTQYCMTHFLAQYWTGSAWTEVPGGSILNNNRIWVQIGPFTPVTTTKIRIYITAAQANAEGYGILTEVEAWSNASGAGGPTFTQIQLLLPGETAAPGTLTGKTGTPTAQVAGTAFTVTARSVDATFNLVSSTDVVGITSSDVYATLPSTAALVAGSKTFSVTLNVAGTATITASDITNSSKTPNTSPSVTVSAGAATKLQLLVPNEVANPGSATGKTGAAIAEAAGAAFSVTARLVDANNNLVSGTHTVGITSNDGAAVLNPAYHALVAGTWTFTNGVTLNTLGPRTITATDITDGSKTASVATVTCGTRSVVGIGDFSAYLGAIRVPIEIGSESRAAATMRRVGGVLQCLMTGHANTSNVYEFILPAPSLSWQGTTRPTVKTDWGHNGGFYGTAKTSWVGSTPVYNCQVPYDTNQYCGWTVHGLWWDETQQCVHWVYSYNYNTSGRHDYCLARTIPGDPLTGTGCVVRGPYRTDVGPHQAGGYVIGIPPAFGDAYANGARIGVGSGIISGNASSSFGPNLIVLPAPTPSTIQGIDSGFASLTTTRVVGYTGANGAKTDRLIRDNGYFAQAGFGDFPPVGAAGYSTTIDFMSVAAGPGKNSLSGAMWIDLPDKQGLLFGFTQTTGAVFYQVGGTALQCSLCPPTLATWPQPFTDPVYNGGNPVCPACYCAQGPVAEGFRPQFAVYSETDLALVAQGSTPKYLVPSSMFDPRTITGSSSIALECTQNLIPIHFDPTTRYAYFAAPGADSDQSPIIHVWQLS